jgi:2-phosphoglycerate kinase
MPSRTNPNPATNGSGLTVRFGRSELPFSKGLLAQSLLATAMEPVEAFEVARQIERELLEDGVRSIDRTELRARTARALERTLGRDPAERYLLWRRQQEPDRPVVLLLGGTSGVGKSALAVEVARRLGIDRVLSTDSIRQIMRIMTSPQLVPALYGSSYDAWRQLPRDGGDTPTVLEGFRAQASAVSVGIRASLDRTIAESANLVVDGVSIVPGAMDLAPYAETAHVVTLLVATLDEDALRQRFVARADGQKRRLAHRYLENFDGILAIQRHLIDQAERHHVPVIDNVSFDASVRQVIDAATTVLRARTAT